MKWLVALLLFISAPAHAALDPVEFFLGRTRGEGTLKIILQAPKHLSVDSIGRQEKDGTLVLQQTIRGGGKAPRTRYWRLRRKGPASFEGTLTDAAGPVRIDVIGERVRIRYRSKDHLNIEQWLTAAGPRQVNNAMRVKRFGITVAHLDEVIRKLD
jgi:hypothetical protein